MTTTKERIFGAKEMFIGAEEIARREKLARKYGGEFHAIPTSRGCECGHGCKRGECPVRNTWFTLPFGVPDYHGEMIMAIIRGQLKDSAYS